MAVLLKSRETGYAVQLTNGKILAWIGDSAGSGEMTQPIAAYPAEILQKCFGFQKRVRFCRCASGMNGSITMDRLNGKCERSHDDLSRANSVENRLLQPGLVPFHRFDSGL